MKEIKRIKRVGMNGRFYYSVSFGYESALISIHEHGEEKAKQLAVDKLKLLMAGSRINLSGRKVYVKSETRTYENPLPIGVHVGWSAPNGNAMQPILTLSITTASGNKLRIGKRFLRKGVRHAATCIHSVMKQNEYVVPELNVFIALIKQVIVSRALEYNFNVRNICDWDNQSYEIK